MKLQEVVCDTITKHPPTKIPVSIFFGSWTILCCESSLMTEGAGLICVLLRLRSGAKWASKFTDLTRSLCGVRCIVGLWLRGNVPYSECTGSRGAGGQLPPIKLNKSTWNHAIYYNYAIVIRYRLKIWSCNLQVHFC